MTFIEPVDSRVYRLEDELNRLAGTVVNGMPTLGKATAALWWLGHRELAWAMENRVPENVATGCEALLDTSGFVALDGQVLDVIEHPAIVGSHVLRITPITAKARSIAASEVQYIGSAIGFADPIPVEPWHIYTASIYTQKRQAEGETPSRANWMYLVWEDAAGVEIRRDKGDHHVSKAEWNLSWVTAPAPENAVTCRVIIDWEQGPNEVFYADKAVFHNGSDPQAWGYPAHGPTDLVAGLRAHLNMKAGRFASADFVTVEQACDMIAGSQVGDAAYALSFIPTPDLAVAPH